MQGIVRGCGGNLSIFVAGGWCALWVVVSDFAVVQGCGGGAKCGGGGANGGGSIAGTSRGDGGGGVQKVV